MNTAKELAFKAWCDAMILAKSKFMPVDEAKDRFELWWSDWYTCQNHKKGWNPEHKVYIDGKTYIRAE
jgi:hypothetical protein